MVDAAVRSAETDRRVRVDEILDAAHREALAAGDAAERHILATGDSPRRALA